MDKHTIFRRETPPPVLCMIHLFCLLAGNPIAVQDIWRKGGEQLEGQTFDLEAISSLDITRSIGNVLPVVFNLSGTCIVMI